jgi:hypothetical protein
MASQARRLEDELQAEKARWQSEREYMKEIERLKDDNDRQQNMLSVNLRKDTQTQINSLKQQLTERNLVSTE